MNNFSQTLTIIIPPCAEMEFFMQLIGLTGSSGSGKSCVSDELRRRHFPTFDADFEYHKLIEKDGPCARDLAQEFGSDILLKDGGINRKMLADIVFAPTNNRDERIAALNRITHHYVSDRMHEWLFACQKSGARLAILDAPTLIESGLDRECDAIIVVTAPKKLRKERIVERDHLDFASAQRRLDAQPKEEFYTERADFVIHNDGDRTALITQVDQICRVLLRKNDR